MTNIGKFLAVFITALLFSSNLFGVPKSAADKKFKTPKNIIIMIGDGMGFNQVEAADYYMYGEKGLQKYENFPVKLAVSTYPAKIGEYPEKLNWASGYNPAKYWKSFKYGLENSTESAAAATALGTGKKTYNNSIGMDLDYKPLENLCQLAKGLGKSAGVITSVPLSHATPAGFSAHNVTRKNYSAIAHELIHDSRLDVVIGCGNPLFDDNGKLTAKKKYFDFVGDSLMWDGLHKNSKEFIYEGKTRTVQDCNGDGKPDPWTLAETREDFQKIIKGKIPKRLLGVPQVISTLQQGREGRADAKPFETAFNKNIPTLAELSMAGLNTLGRNKKGFFVMIEGGAIDWCNHANNKGRLIEEMYDFNKAIDTVVAWIEKNSSWDETLLIVTADHESGYLWGPDSKEPDTFNPVKNNGKGVLPEMTYYTGGHSNSLVPIFAKGGGSQLFDFFADETDPGHGKFFTNTRIPETVFLLWRYIK